MKRVAILSMAVFMMAVSVPVFAADMVTQQQKDECLLASKECKNSVDSIQQKIDKLQGEVRKGTKVYSKDEIDRLNAKLKEAQDLLEKMFENP